MSHNQKIGQYGEQLALNYLKKHGFEIVRQNLKISYFEIDIIAIKNGWYYFIEVKTRLSDFCGTAEEAITARKIHSLKKGASYYILKNKIDENYVNFDFIAVDINKKQKIAKIKHYSNIV